MKNPETVANIFTILVRDASEVYISDANCKQSTVAFMTDIGHRSLDSSFFYKNETVRNRRKIYFLNGKGDLIQRAIDKLLAGEKVFIPTNSRVFGNYAWKQIEKACPNIKIKMFDKTTILITTDADGNPIDPIAEFINYDCVICTPLLQAGNSFIHEHFHHCFAYASGASSSPEAFSQLIMRVRFVINKDLYLYVDNRLGPNKKVDTTINTFEDMQNKFRTKNRLLSEEHDIHLSRSQIMKLRWSLNNTIDIYNPLTAIEIASSYNLNEGYKNYTNRLLSIIRSYGFEFGESLITDDEQARKSEIAISKEIRASAQNEEMQLCTGMATVPLPNLEQFDEIKSRLRQEDRGIIPTKMVATTDSNGETTYQTVEAPVTKEERLQVKKYNLFVTNDIKLPNTADPIQIFNAKKFVYKKKLIKYFLPLVVLPRINETRRAQIFEYMLRDIDQRTNHIIEDSNPNVSTKIYKTLKNADKALYHAFVIHHLQLLGFTHGFFHTETVDLKETKPLLANDLKSKIQTYQSIFGRTTIGNIGGKTMMSWLNANLDMYGIQLKRKNNKTQMWYIDSPWQVVIESGEVKVRHQDETQILPEAYKQSFNDEFLDQLISIMDNPMYLPVLTDNLEGALYNDPAYNNIQRISDRVSWNYHIQKAKHDHNYELIKKYAFVKENEDKIIRFELARKDNPNLTWNIFLERLNKPSSVVEHNSRQEPIVQYPLKLTLD
jgi:hypothetical protein